MIFKPWKALFSFTRRNLLYRLDCQNKTTDSTSDDSCFRKYDFSITSHRNKILNVDNIKVENTNIGNIWDISFSRYHRYYTNSHFVQVNYIRDQIFAILLGCDTIKKSWFSKQGLNILSFLFSNTVHSQCLRSPSWITNEFLYWNNYYCNCNTCN